MSDLHNEIMNLQIGGEGTPIAREALTDSGGVHIAYKIGHRDARHAAAELAAAYENHHAELVELVDSAATALEMAGYMETASMLRGKLAGLDTKKA